MFLARIYLAFSIFVPTTLAGQNPTDIIQKYFEIVSNGNVSNWDTIKSVYIEGTTFYQDVKSQPNFLNPPKPSYQKLYREWPDKLRIELYDDSTFTNIKSVNLWLPGKFIQEFRSMQPITKPWKDNPWDFNPVYISKLLKKSKSIQFNGIKKFEADNISCFDIEVQTNDLTIDLYFNTSSYLLDYWKVFNSSDPSNYAKFYDYRSIGGFLFDMATFGTHNGIMFFSYKINTILINPAIDKEKFK